MIKGPFALAHMSFAKSFYYGYNKSKDKQIFPAFAFLDDSSIPKEIQDCSYDLTKYSTFDKMLKLKSIISLKINSLAYLNPWDHSKIIDLSSLSRVESLGSPEA